jgi:hypothetical protein
MTLRGLLASPRVALVERASLDLGALGLGGGGLVDVAAALGLPRAPARIALALASAGALAWLALRDPGFRARPRLVGSGVAVGLLIVAGWAATGILGRDDFQPTPLASLTFVAPVGDALLYLALFTGVSLSFGVAVVGGVVAGAFLSALARGTLRLEGFADRGDLGRHLLGGALMGIGGVLALGCTIGQGLTGLSTLSLGSLLAIAGIATGGALGTLYLEEGAFGATLRRLAGRA